MSQILYVDDDVMQDARYYYSGLEGNGFTVLYYNDPDDALVFIRTHAIAISAAIFDLVLPKFHHAEYATVGDDMYSGEILYREYRKRYLVRLCTFSRK